MGRRRDSRILVNGHSRILRDELERIRREVREQYAKELAEAGFLCRLVLRMHIRKEVRARLDDVAPRDGLYARR